MGNYESARISIGVSVPCYFEELGDAHDFAVKWAEERVKAEVVAVRSTKSEF